MLLFSEWNELVDGEYRLQARLGGWRRGPDTRLGNQRIASCLEPLADLLGNRVRYGARVTGVSRRGRDRLVDADRQASHSRCTPIRPMASAQLQACAVADASETWQLPNPAGGGRPALGEPGGSEVLTYRMPDFRNTAEQTGRPRATWDAYLEVIL